MNTLLLDLALRWLHILSAIALTGGAVFWRTAVTRGLESLPEDARQQASAAIRSRWSRWVMGSSGLLLVTGLVNFRNCKRGQVHISDKDA